MKLSANTSRRTIRILVTFSIAMVATSWLVKIGAGKMNPKEQKPTSNKAKESTKYETAIFGAGCFWGVEAAFRQVRGVKSTTVGYSGGHVKKPTYRDVCTNRTGHAEVVQLIYDPNKVTYDKLLEVFWKIHDPTTLNRQGPDFGSQYRSVIFYNTHVQKASAESYREKLQKSGRYKKTIVTEIAPAAEFYRAEEYHQRYLEKRRLKSCKISK